MRFIAAADVALWIDLNGNVQTVFFAKSPQPALRCRLYLSQYTATDPQEREPAHPPQPDSLSHQHATRWPRARPDPNRALAQSITRAPRAAS